MNPGLLKSKMRDIATSLSQYLNMEKASNRSIQNTHHKKDENTLFNDITDAEIDHMFSFAKN